MGDALGLKYEPQLFKIFLIVALKAMLRQPFTSSK
jgi:hypothetical protein